MRLNDGQKFRETNLVPVDQEKNIRIAASQQKEIPGKDPGELVITKNVNYE